MAVNSGNIEIVTNHGLEYIPKCEHGPSLLFSRFDKKHGSERHFFACSAFRDRKACPFFKWADDLKNTNDKPITKAERTDLWPTYNHAKMRKRFIEFKNLKESERHFCTNCGLMLLPGEQKGHEGQGHTLRSNISNEMLSKPTQLFTPLENNKTYAQYLFSSTAINFILETLNTLNVTHVLCVGCPSIHEALQAQCKNNKNKAFPKSLLLDLDHRYLQVFPEKEFCRYNMLNHHFFGGDSDQEIFKKFITEDAGNVAMVIDPPFGVMVDALNVTINRIHEQWRANKKCEATAEMAVFWFFPYFMEQRVVTPTSSYTMLDYKVDYDNHALFKGEKGRKKGSPVRIFTNLPATQIVLPQSEGYWYCEKCKRYCSEENKHCEKCNTCPTKDGNTYTHCDKCNRCVKPSRVHCNTCNICDLQDHKCGQSMNKGCHVCGEMDHKRRDCPKRQSFTENSNNRSIKRKGNHQVTHVKKKRRK